MDSLFLSEEFSDIKLNVVGSDKSAIIPAHKAILIQNSYYFWDKFDFLNSVPMKPDEALVVDVSYEGTLQDGLDVLQIFYLSFGKLISESEQKNFAKLNSNTLSKFSFKDIKFVYSNIFDSIGNIKFISKEDDLEHGFTGLLDDDNFLTCYFNNNEFNIIFESYRKKGKERYKTKKELEIVMNQYKEFTSHLYVFFRKNKILSRLENNREMQNFIINIFQIIIPLYDNENVKILFNDIKRKSDQKVKDIIDSEYPLNK